MVDECLLFPFEELFAVEKNRLLLEDILVVEIISNHKNLIPTLGLPTKRAIIESSNITLAFHYQNLLFCL